jgi:hypothetical protein
MGRVLDLIRKPKKKTAAQTLREDVDSKIVGLNRNVHKSLTLTAGRIVRLELMVVLLTGIVLVEGGALVWLLGR